MASATHLALVSASALGLQSASGLLWRGLPEKADVGDFLSAHPPIAALVGDMLLDTYAWTRELVRDHVALVQNVAGALLDQGVLAGAEVEKMVRKYLAIQREASLIGDGGR